MKKIYLISPNGYADNISLEAFATTEEGIKALVVYYTGNFGWEIIPNSFYFDWDRKEVSFSFYWPHDKEEADHTTYVIHEIEPVRMTGELK